jgi:hypothetical protein
VATIHVPGTGFRPHGGKHVRRAAILGAAGLAFAAIMVPFVVHEVGGGKGAEATAATRSTPPSVSPTTQQHPPTDPVVGPRGNLPDLLPARSRLSDGARVRLGNVTDGVLRRTPTGAWQVLVRWDGRLQPVPLRGPVRFAAGPASSWITADGLLYTRISTSDPDRFRVYAWEPRGSSAYTPPTLVATSLGTVCFNRAFTAFGTCPSAS